MHFFNGAVFTSIEDFLCRTKMHFSPAPLSKTVLAEGLVTHQVFLSHSFISVCTQKVQRGCLSLLKQDWLLLHQSIWLIEYCSSPNSFERKNVYIVPVRIKVSRISQRVTTWIHLKAICLSSSCPVRYTSVTNQKYLKSHRSAADVLWGTRLWRDR